MEYCFWKVGHFATPTAPAVRPKRESVADNAIFTRSESDPLSLAGRVANAKMVTPDPLRSLGEFGEMEAPPAGRGFAA